jgi:hypothetical protein
MDEKCIYNFNGEMPKEQPNERSGICWKNNMKTNLRDIGFEVES